MGPVKNSPRGGLEVGDKGGELEDLGAQLQSLEDVSNGDKELEELGEDLQSLEGVADGPRSQGAKETLGAALRKCDVTQRILRTAPAL